MTKQQYIKQRNDRFAITYPNYRKYAYLNKKFIKEIEQLPSELKENYESLSYIDKYECILTQTNNMIKGVGKDNIGSYLQSVIIQYFFKLHKSSN